MPASDPVPAVPLGLRRREQHAGPPLPCAVVFLTLLILDTKVTKAGTLKAGLLGGKILHVMCQPCGKNIICQICLKEGQKLLPKRTIVVC